MKNNDKPNDKSEYLYSRGIAVTLLTTIQVIILFLLTVPLYFAIPISTLISFFLEPHLAKSYKENFEEKAAKREKDRLELEERLRKSEQLRDAEFQDAPYTYQIGVHGNKMLALRYGIVNNYVESNCNKEGFDWNVENQKITLKKIKKIKRGHYEVILPELGGGTAIAVIEPGTEYVKTFYPRSEQWFCDFADLENLIKNNPSFSNRYIAKLHVKAVLKRTKLK